MAAFLRASETRTHTHLIEKRVAGEAQGIGIANPPKPSAVVIRETMTAIGDAGCGVQLDLGGKFARRHSCHRRHGLPSASRVIGIHGTAQQRLFGIGKQRVVLLLSGNKFREKSWDQNSGCSPRPRSLRCEGPCATIAPPGLSAKACSAVF